MRNLSRSLFLMMWLGFVALAPRVQGEQPWSKWRSYSSAFMVDGRIVDRQGNNRTTSEGQAYGMFFALVANDRDGFDKLLQWTTDNLAQGNLNAHLPAWLWGQGSEGQWRVLDPNSAADADLWLAYSLREAGRLWQEPRYEALGHAIVNRMQREEVADLPGLGPMLLPGPSGFHPSANVWLLNPSYLPLPLVVRMARLDPKSPWAAMSQSLPQFLARSSARGIAMDWVSYSPDGGFLAAAFPGSSAPTGAVGSYDAIRVYLWAGLTDTRTPGRDEMLRAIPAMAMYLATRPLPPERVDADGIAVAGNGSVGFSAALIPYLSALGKKGLCDEQEARVTVSANPTTGLYGQPATYYDQNLVLFGEGWLRRRFRFGADGELEVTWKR